MMKTFALHIFLICTAASAAIGCARDESDLPPASGGIQFEAMADRMDREGETSHGNDVTTTYTIPDFRVSAFKQWETLMDNVVVTRTGINSWIYSPAVDWPENDSVDFFAVSPSSVKINNNQWWYHSFRYVNTDCATDLLISVKRKAVQSDGRIRLNFRHALAKVQVRLKTSDPASEIKVDQVEVRNIHLYGEFYYPQTTTSPDTNKGELFKCWNVYSANEIITLFQASDGNTLDPSGEATIVGPENLFMLPDSLTTLDQQQHWTGTHIYLSYSRNGVANIARIGLRESTPDAKWLPGRCYRYTVDITPAHNLTRGEGKEPENISITCDAIDM